MNTYSIPAVTPGRAFGSNTGTFTAGLWLALCLLAGAPVAPAQQALDDMVYTVGTTIRDPAHRDWAYLLWQAVDPRQLQGRSLAIYSKAGDSSSTNLYQRTAIASLQTDPHVLEPLLRRGENVGEDMAGLDNVINRLFQKIIPAGNLTLAEKLSAVIRGALADEEQFGNLLHLSRQHPGVSLGLGIAHAEMIGPGLTTFEIRDYDLSRKQDRAVIGRITVEAGAPIVLPAPGRPVDVPETSAKGNLNVRLRWAIPNELRRLILLNYGFNVYRMTRAFAEGAGFNTQPPPTLALRSLIHAQPDQVKQINSKPILNQQDYDSLTVSNFVADATSFFVADDNGRFQPGGQPLVTGDQFYYFATARDVLGRDGLVSPGTLVTVCDRMPPPVPNGLKVVNEYTFNQGAPKQVLRISWPQNPETAEDLTARYYVYRWDNQEEINLLAGDPQLHRISGPIPHQPGQALNSFLDDGAGAPTAAQNASQTFWYTVRAEDPAVGTCEGNLSGNSPPAFGVLRDRAGPAAPSGSVRSLCLYPKVSFLPKESARIHSAEANESVIRHRLIGRRAHPGIQWVEFSWQLRDSALPARLFGRKHFRKGSDTVVLDCEIDRDQSAFESYLVLCVAGDAMGNTSPPAAATQVVPAADQVGQLVFEATEDNHPPAEMAVACHSHVSRAPDGGFVPIHLDFLPTPTSREWKVFRRVDEGPFTLLVEGRFTNDPPPAITYDDPDLPANDCSICYFAQVFDEHGNPSPMTLLDCVEVQGKTPLPTPMLAAVQSEAGSTADDPRMVITWFCPPHGVDHFEVWVASTPQPVNAGATFSAALSANQATSPNLADVSLNGETQSLDFKVYRTGPVGGGLGNGPQFIVVANLTAGVTNTILIRPVGKTGNPDQIQSNVERYAWHPPVDPVPEVPWPARPLPRVKSSVLFVGETEPAHRIWARRLPDNHRPVGIRVGEFVPPGRWDIELPPRNLTPGAVDPLTYFYAHGDAASSSTTNRETAMPFVLYRYQVPNNYFATVSGDLIQASPLMEKIAYQNGNDKVLGPHAILRDPFILVARYPGKAVFEMFMLDTQPVIIGARYRYLLVRFLKNGEIDEVIPTNEVTITPWP